jgi:ComF family protein
MAVSFIVPPYCVACGSEPRDPRAVLCPECRPLLVPIGSSSCPRCALPLPCSPCVAADAHWDAAGAAVRYGQQASAVAVAFKQSGSRRIANLMAQLMAAAESCPALDQSVLVPVPMDPRRRRKTGVDHADLLARAFSRSTGRPVMQPLVRIRAKRVVKQAGAGRQERLQAQRILIEARVQSPTACVLVDDVHTTGATLRTAAQALVEGGARRVACMTFARALPPA